MRMLVVALVSLGFLGSAPGARAAAEVLASRAEAAAPVAEVPGTLVEAARPVATEQRTGPTAQEVATGALLVGGAFVVGLVAGGTLSTAIVSAGTVIVIYSLLP